MTDCAHRTELAIDLVSQWERQQEVYIPQRELRFELMLDVIGHRLSGDRPRVLDLACGPGSATDRVLARFPHAEIVAVDLDPLLLELGRLRHADADRHPTWIQCDLAAADWADQLPLTEFDAIISTTALHWLSGSQLSDVYRRVRPLVAPGGVFLNGDYLPLSRPWGELAEMTRVLGEKREKAETAQGALDWDTWWQAVRAMPEFEAEMVAHDEIFSARPRFDAPSLTFHLEALRESGFAQVDVIWQDLTEGLICAL